MEIRFDMSKVVPVAEMRGDDDEDTLLLRKSLTEAEEFLADFQWCDGILESYFGIGVGGIFAVFLFRIAHSRPDVDDWVWVVVGDLPPAYITCDQAPNPATALNGYIGAMREWAEAAMAGKDVAELIPVTAAATPEHGRMLSSRLDFLSEFLETNHQDGLVAS